MQPDATPYRDAGWQLIPLHRWDDKAQDDGRPLGKAPAHANWSKREYPDAEVDAAIASGRNVGARPNALQVVVDYDPRNDPEGVGLAKLQELLGPYFATMPRVKTGSDGLHLYARLRDPVKLRNSVDALPGVEMKGRGRQVLVGGCRHPNGRYYTWDPFAAELVDAPFLPEALLEVYRRPDAAAHRGDVVAELTPDQLRTALSKLDPLDYGEHDRWLALGMACWAAVAGDPEGMAIFIEWSTSDPKYADHAPLIEMRWNTWAPKDGEAAITARSLFAELPDSHGMYVHLVDDLPPIEGEWKKPAEVSGVSEEDFVKGKGGFPIACPHNVRVALRLLGARLSFNDFTYREMIEWEGNPAVEVRLRGRGDVVLEDAALNRLWTAMETRFGFSSKIDMLLRVVQDEARRACFHPVRDFLSGLEWDGIERLGDWLQRLGGAKDTPYVRAVGALQLIGAVRRVRRPGCKKHEVLVFEGAQGTGKSSAIQILACRPEWFTDQLSFGADGKEAQEQLGGRWIVEIAELQGMRKQQAERVKAFLAANEDSARPAYGRGRFDAPRQCAFFGSTNSDRYLRDLSGNRRFWPVRIDRFDLVGLRAEVEQLWAEASALESTGMPIELGEKLWAEAEVEQVARTVSDDFQDMLQDALDGIEFGKIRREEVGRAVGRDTGRGFGGDELERVEAALARMGWEKPASALYFGEERTKRCYAKGDHRARQALPTLRFDSGKRRFVDEAEMLAAM